MFKYHANIFSFTMIVNLPKIVNTNFDIGRQFTKWVDNMTVT